MLESARLPLDLEDSSTQLMESLEYLTSSWLISTSRVSHRPTQASCEPLRSHKSRCEWGLRSTEQGLDCVRRAWYAVAYSNLYSGWERLPSTQALYISLPLEHQSGLCQEVSMNVSQTFICANYYSGIKSHKWGLNCPFLLFILLN